MCEFASLDSVADLKLVISALKANNNNVESVIMAYFDGADKFRQTYSWSESHFTEDPDVPSFTINPADESNIIQGVNPNHLRKTPYDTNFPYLDSAPPSHPPSRATSPVPVTNINGWINETQHAQYNIPSTLAQEDEDLERALAESAAMSGIHTPQETGITGGSGAANIGLAEASQPSGADTDYPSNFVRPPRPEVAIAPKPQPIQLDSATPYFGPASRTEYNANDWAMTRIAPSTRYAKPSARTRAPQTPAFLASTDSNYVNATLTVLHSIATARNALLRFGGIEPHTYGNSPGWWKGEAISPSGNLKNGPEEFGETIVAEDGTEVYIGPPSVDRDDDEKVTHGALPLGTIASREFIEETQRLMAFLDGSERSYAYVDALQETSLMKLVEESDKTRAFAKVLSWFLLSDFNKSLFTVVTMVRYATGRVQETITDNYMLLDLSNENNAGDALPCTSLYSLLDNVYWSWLGGMVGPEPLEQVAEYKTAFVSRMAPVQLLRLNPRDNRMTGSFSANAYSLEGLSGEAAGLKEPPATGPYAQLPPIDIPETVYLDRYAEENQVWALGIQDKMRRIMAELVRLQHLVEKIDPSGRKSKGKANEKNNDKGKGKAVADAPEQIIGPQTAEAVEAAEVKMDAVTLYNRRVRNAILQLWQYKSKVLWDRSVARGIDFNSADVDAVKPETDEEKAVFNYTRAQIAVAKKNLVAYRKAVAEIQAQRDAIWRLLTRLRKKRTEPTAEDKLKYKYKLRGVVISANRFYICRRELVPEDEVIDLDDVEIPDVEEVEVEAEEADNTEKTETSEESKKTTEKTPVYRDQWWKVMHRDENTFVQKSTVEAAIADARTLQMQIILAYCTDEAWAAEPDPLSDTLKTFVKHDNRHFKTEREAETREQAAAAQNKKRAQQGTPVEDYSVEMSPIKRRNQRSSSIDSMASQRSSMASDKAFDGGDDLVDLSDREMEDMPLLSRQETNSTKIEPTKEIVAAASAMTAMAGGVSGYTQSDFNSEDSSVDFDDGGAYKNAQLEEAIRLSLQDQKQEETTKEEDKEAQPAQSSPLGKSMVDLAISQEVERKLDEEKTATERVMQEQVRVPKNTDDKDSYPDEKKRLKEKEAKESERQFSTGVQLVADWDNPEGRYVPDDMDES